MNERPIAAATVSPLRVRLDAESEQVLVARLACSTIGGVMNSGRVPPRRGFASPAKKIANGTLGKATNTAPSCSQPSDRETATKRRKSLQVDGSLNLCVRRLGRGLYLRHKLHDSKGSGFRSMPLKRSPILVSVSA